MTAASRSALTPIGLALAIAASGTQAQDLSRLQNILATTPDGGWAKVNLGTLSSAFPTGLDAVPEAYAAGGPQRIVSAWSSMAWDSADNQLLLWGGGHANYSGNEMYRWDAASGQWSRGSLPSALVTTDSSLPVVGNGAPESAHTYAGNAWLATNKMFVTFGGATFPNGGGGSYYDTNHQATGPWLWDPSKADPNKVGGATGTGWDPSRAGGNMWINRAPATTGPSPTNWIYTASVSRVEAGKDVVYVAADTYNGSVFSTLYRYQVGDVRNGGTDSWTVVGHMPDSEALGFTRQGAAAIDSTHNLYVRTGQIDPNLFDNVPSTEDAFIVWDLSKTSQGGANMSKAVRLVDSAGRTINFNSYASGIDFDSATGNFYLWSSQNQGQVITTHAQYDANGNLLDTWQASVLNPTTSLQPTLATQNGVLGKWEYVSGLHAFIALEEYSPDTGDAGVWLYKPSIAAAVPEVNTAALLFAGLMGVMWVARRRLRA